MTDEQRPSDTAGESQENVDDLWSSAFEESGDVMGEGEMSAAEKPAPQAQAVQDTAPVFKQMSVKDSGLEISPRDLEVIMDVPVTLGVELGRTRITVKQLLNTTQGSVIELDGLAGEPMDISINNHLIAKGEVVVIGDKYGIRITEIVSPSDRMQRLSR